jgi:hypothetical protein
MRNPLGRRPLESAILLVVSITTLSCLSAPVAGAQPPSGQERRLAGERLGGILGRDHLFSVRPLLAFSPDGAFLCLGDRFGRAVVACDFEGRELWSVPMAPGEEVSELAIDPAGRLVVRTRGSAMIRIYDQPSIPPREASLPLGWPAAREADLLRVDGELLLRSTGERLCYRLGGDGGVVGIDTLPVAKPEVYAYGPRGAFWFWKEGDNRLLGRGGKSLIRLDAPLSTHSLIACGPDGNVWTCDPRRGRLAVYTPNGFARQAYLLDPPPVEPAGIWIDDVGRIWIADRRDGRIVRYVP